MKIVLVSFLYEIKLGGGASVVVNQLANSLTTAGHEVIVLTSWGGRYVKTEILNGIKIIRLPAFNLYWVFNKDKHASYKKILWQLLDVWNPWVYHVCLKIFTLEAPDIVHVHKLRGLSPSVWSAASSAKVGKIIHTCHDYELFSPEGMLMGWIGELAMQQSILMRPYQGVRRYLSRYVQYVTAPSKFVLGMHQRMRYFSLANASVISNSHGFTEDEIKSCHVERQLLFEKDDVIRFLYIGRLDKSKGVDKLCQSFAQAVKHRSNMILTVAGWGGLDEYLRTKYGDISQIEFVGPVFGEQKKDLFKKSDVLVCPSVTPEPFGIVVVEAYFYGLPVIATHTGALQEIVRNGETGILLDNNSEELLSSTLLNVCENKKLVKEMSKICHKEAYKYSIEKFIAAYFAIYDIGKVEN